MAIGDLVREGGAQVTSQDAVEGVTLTSRVNRILRGARDTVSKAAHVCMDFANKCKHMVMGFFDKENSTYESKSGLSENYDSKEKYQ